MRQTKNNNFSITTILVLMLLAIPGMLLAQINPGDVITTNLTLTADLDASSYNGPAIRVGANNVTIDGAGFTITVSGNNSGIELYNRSGVTITNVTVVGATANYGRGVSLSNANGAIIQNNDFSGLYNALYVSGTSSNILIDNNDMSGSSHYGLWSNNSNNINWTVTNNDFTGGASWGLHYLGLPAEISGNDFTGSAYGLILQNVNASAGNEFELTWQGAASGPNQNTFGGHTGQALEIHNSRYVNISGWDMPSLYLNPEQRRGLQMGSVSYSVFENNNLSGMYNAIYVSGTGSDNLINNNDMSGSNHYGMWSNNSNNINWTVTNNDFTGGASWGLHYLGTPAEISGNDFTGSTHGLYLQNLSGTAGSEFELTWQGAASGPNMNTFGGQTSNAVNLNGVNYINVSGWDFPSLYVDPTTQRGLNISNVRYSIFANNDFSGMSNGVYASGTNINNLWDSNNFSGSLSTAYYGNSTNEQGSRFINNDFTGGANWALHVGGAVAEINNNDFTGSTYGLYLYSAAWSAGNEFELTWQGAGSGPNRNTFGGQTSNAVNLNGVNYINVSGWDFPSLYVDPATQRGLNISNVRYSIFANNDFSGMSNGVYSGGTNINNLWDSNNFSGSLSTAYYGNSTNEQGSRFINNDFTGGANWGLHVGGAVAEINNNDFTGSTYGLYLYSAAWSAGNEFELTSQDAASGPNQNTFGGQTSNAVSLNGVNYINISGWDFPSLYVDPATQRGLNISNVRYSIFANNDFSGMSNGVYSGGTNINNLWDSNDFSGSLSTAYYGNNTNEQGSRFINNNFTNAGSWGLHVGGTIAEISGNNFTGAVSGIYLRSASNYTLNGNSNTFDLADGATAIGLDYSNGVTVEDLTVVGNGGRAVNVSNSHNITIDGLETCGKSDGVFISNGNGHIVQNSSFSEANTGINTGNGTTLQVIDNTFHNVTTEVAHSTLYSTVTVSGSQTVASAAWCPAPPNTVPVADAGTDASIQLGAGESTVTVTLDGSASTDAEGDILSYSWTGSFGSATGETPSVSLSAGSNSIELTVDDGNGGSATDIVVVEVLEFVQIVTLTETFITDETGISVTGGLVVANNLGGGAQPVQVGCIPFGNSAAGLSGWANGGGDFCVECPAGSPMGTLLDGLVFQPGGSDVSLTLSGLTAGNDYRLQLLMSNDVNSTGNTATVEVEGTTISLTGYQPNTLNITAEFVAVGPTALVRFIYTGGGTPDRAVLNAYVLHDLTQPNMVCNSDPVADAGVDQFVTRTGPLTSVVLDGSGTTDVDTTDVLTYNWSWTGGSATGVSPTISLAVGTHTITLDVDDQNGGTASDLLEVTIDQSAFEQTFTILGGNGTVGDIDPYTQALPEGATEWQQAYLTGGHPWGFVSGTNSWVNFDPDDEVGINTRTPYRIRFMVPADFENPSMVFNLKADNRALVWINDTFIDSVDGQGSPAVDATIAEPALHVGLNEIRIMLVDWGGIVGLNYRVDVTMTSAEDVTDAVLTPDEAALLNNPPVADAGADQSILVASASLDGSVSSDPDGNILTYSWSENGIVIATGVNPTLVLADGTHTIILTVSDGELSSTDEMVMVVSTNVAPLAAAGIDQSIDCVVANADVTLDGSASSDADGDSLTYSWMLNALEVSTSASFTASLSAGTHEYTLTVNDGLLTSSDMVSVTVVADTEAPTLTLLGTGPFGVNLHGAWTDPGFEATDVCDDSVTVVVTGAVDAETPGDYTLTYTATDESGNETVATRVVTVINAAPVALAGDAQNFECIVGSVDVDLDASASSDADGDAMTYSWVIDSVEVSTSASFTATLAGGTHIYTLTVSDDFDSSTDEVTITIIEDSEPPVLSLDGDNPAMLGLYIDYVELGFEAIDACDDNPTVDVTGSIDINIPGDYTLTYTATDAGGNSSSTERVVTVFNTAPEVVDAVVGVELSFGDDALSTDIDLSMVFADVDINDVLTYSFANGNDAAATVSLSGTILSISAVDLGETQVTVTAMDPWGEEAVDVFTTVVNVNMDLAESLLFAKTKIEIKKDVEIFTGNIVVNETHQHEQDNDDEDDEDDHDDDENDDDDEDDDDDHGNGHDDDHHHFELKIDKDTYVAAGYLVMADGIEIKKDASVESDVYVNDLNNKGDITGDIYNLMATPIFSTLPPFKSASAGSQNIRVRKNQSLELAPGNYGRIEVDKSASLTFTGGVYNIQKLETKESSHIRFEDVTEVRVEREIKIAKKAYVGPAGGSFIDASDIIFYIDGDHHHAAKLEERVEFYGTIYALEGEVELKKKVSFTGAILGDEIKVDKQSDLYVDSYFAGAAVGLAKGDKSAWIEPEVEFELPMVSELAANYPNPFNPSTTIDFALDKSSDISLKIYDIRGAEVAELANGLHEAGHYTVHFTPENLSSGTYLYVLDTGSFREVHRMVYLK